MLFVFAAGFVALAGLVAAGTLNPLDQAAIDHLMPYYHPAREYHLTLHSIFVPHQAGADAFTNAADIWLYPASVPISCLGVGICCLVLYRRGHLDAALLWAGAWVMGNVVDVVGKTLIQRPALHGTAGGQRIHIGAFDSSFPSGHTIRAVILAAAVAFVWRRARPWAALWTASILVLLVANGDHVPSDVLGGLLVALLLVLPLDTRLRLS